MFRRGEPEDRNEQGQRQQPIQPSEVRMRDQGNASNQEVTVVGKGARLEGTLISAGSLRIDGQVKGKISAESDVLLSAHSHVEAEIQAQNVTIAGRFKGNIVVTGRAELARGGRVDGNVTSKSLVVAEGAIFNGQSIMDQQPAVSAAPRTGQAIVTVPGVPEGNGGSTESSEAESVKARNR
jgi:cytoskeletal protein CcmA (bactofilin family)